MSDRFFNKNLLGTKFGKWIVLGKGAKNNHGFLMLYCRCECGTKRDTRLTHLKSGRSISCGCFRPNNQTGNANLGRPARNLETISSVINTNSVPEPNTGCWLWIAHYNKQGYGKLKIANKTIFAHRASYATFIGEIPEGSQVCHKCDTPECVNPQHLFLGTALDNQQDKVRKGRQARGAQCGTARLTKEQVLEIRSKLENKINIAVIAKEYAIGKTTVQHIKERRTWNHI